MKEEFPLFIQKEDEYFDLVSNDFDDRRIEDVQFTSYLPGARWMYSWHREENLKWMRYGFSGCYFFEILSMIYSGMEGKFLFVYFTTFAGVSGVIGFYFDSVVAQGFFVGKLGFKHHLLSIGIIAYYLIDLDIIGTFILGITGIFQRSWEFELANTNYLVIGNYNLVCFRISMILVCSLYMTVHYLSSYFLIDKHIYPLAAVQVLLITSQNFHIGLSSILFFTHKYFSEPSQDTKELSLIATLSTNFIILFFKIITIKPA